MLKEFLGKDPGDLTNRQVEKAIISAQSEYLDLRAPGKYKPILFVVSLFPDLEVLYHFGRKVDDIVDGDTELPVGFDNSVDVLEHLAEVAISNERVEKSFSIDYLLARSINRLEKISNGRDDIQGLVLNFLEGMKLEYLSRYNRVTFSDAELSRLYRLAFEPAQDIALICLGAKRRSESIPELSQIQGRSYSIADIESDLGTGIIRIPDKIIFESGLNVGNLQENPLLAKANPIISSWMINEKKVCKLLKRDLFDRDMDIKTKLFCSFLTIKV